MGGDLFENVFFFEVDQSTGPRETLAKRVYGYQDFYGSGLAVRYGFTREEYTDSLPGLHGASERRTAQQHGGATDTEWAAGLDQVWLIIF
jgi:hypothetical protein